MSEYAPIRGSEHDDIVPKDWGCYVDGTTGEIVVCVSAYMEIPEIPGYQNPDSFDTAAGVLVGDLRTMLDNYINNCMDEDDGGGLLPLASLFTEYAQKLHAKYSELREEIEEAERSFQELLEGISKNARQDT